MIPKKQQTTQSLQCEKAEEKVYLKPGTLTSTSLLLNRHDLQNLIFQRRPQEEIDDL